MSDIRRKNPQTPRDFGIGIRQVAQVSPEHVLVETLFGFDIPEPAGVRADLVRNHQPLEFILPNPADLDLEIDQADTDAMHHAGEKIIHAQRNRYDIIEVLLGSPTERDDVFLRHKRVAQRVILVRELYNRTWQLGPFFKTQSLCHRSCGEIAHNDFEWNNFHLPDKLLAHVEALDEMGWYSDTLQPCHEILGQTVVERTLALDYRFLFSVIRGRVILEILNDGTRFGAFVQDLCFAFVDFLATGHHYLSNAGGLGRRGLKHGDLCASYAMPPLRASGTTGISLLTKIHSEGRQMTTFDDREHAFEAKFAHDAEMQFKAEARRNKLLGLWAAELMGKSSGEADAYAAEVIKADFAEAGDEDVYRKVSGDLGDLADEATVRAKMKELMATAKAQLLNEV